MVGEKKIIVLCIAFNGAPSTQVRGFRHKHYVDSTKIEWINLKLGKTITIFSSKIILVRVFNRIIRSADQFIKFVNAFSEINKCDVVYLIKYPPKYMIKILKLFHKKIVFDFDDAIWNPEILGGKYFKYILQNVDAYTCDNLYLSEKARELNPNGLILDGLITQLNDDQMSKLDIRDNKNLVWIGSSTTTIYLKQIITEIIKTAMKNPDSEFYILGASAKEFKSEMPQNIKFFGTYSPELMIQIMAIADIGLFPVVKDEIGLARGIHKIRLYLSADLRIIATDTELARSIIKSNNQGILCEKTTDWGTAMQYFINHPRSKKRNFTNYKSESENRKNSNLLSNYLKEIYTSLGKNQC